jgi:hypothetical protein
LKIYKEIVYPSAQTCRNGVNLNLEVGSEVVKPFSWFHFPVNAIATASVMLNQKIKRKCDSCKREGEEGSMLKTILGADKLIRGKHESINQLLQKPVVTYDLSKFSDDPLC